MSPRSFPELPGGAAPLPGTPGRASGELTRPGAGPALPAPAGGAEGGTGLAPMDWSRSAAGGEHSPRPPVRRTQASGVPAHASGTAAREASPGASESKRSSGTAPAQDPSRVLPDETPVSGPGTRGGSTPARGVPVRASAPLAGQSRIAAAMSEDRGPDSLDAHVRRLMRDLGLRGFHAHDARRSEKGYPDWTIAGPGGQMWRELKTQRGTVTREQREWLDLLSSGGGDAGVWRPEDLLSGKVARELAAISAIGRRMPPGGDAA